MSRRRETALTILCVTALLIGCVVFSSCEMLQDLLTPMPEVTDGKDTPPEDTPPEDTPPEDTPPEDTPPEDTPPEDTPPEDTPPEGGEDVYTSGEVIPTLPTSHARVPNLLSNAGIESSSVTGDYTIRFNNGGRIRYGETTYTCVSSPVGCKIENGRVTRGTIEVSGGGE